MVTQHDLETLGEEILTLIEDKGIQPEMFSIGIRISREEYERIKGGLSGTKVDLGNTFALSNPKWAIQLNFPFLKVKPTDSNNSP